MKLESPMFPYAVLCVLLTITCSGAPADHNTVVERHPNNARTDVQGNSALTRRKRAAGLARLAVTGVNALGWILKGAQRLPSGNEKIREFVKHGSYSSAVKDFSSVKPIRVHKRVKYMTGEVGDRILYLTKDGGKGKPVLEIIKKLKIGDEEFSISDRITYID